ncbi:hypothetical protein [Cupriavidus oxalaticus]|uniref:hypothetical protein n=1 Tax=Cupriavidus oxalaticus TaxID=96344 RepID=UPI0040346903
MTTMSGNWSVHDDKNYRGRRDRIFVSRTEEWEIEYFIDHFLKTHQYLVNEKNRAIVLRAVNDYQGSAPIQRAELTRYLEQRWSRSS